MGSGWHNRGDEPVFQALRTTLEGARQQGRKGIDESTHDGAALVLKYGPLRGKSRLRHGARGLFLRRAVPRLAEFENLEWLRGHGFGAPRPVSAGVHRTHGLPDFQFLVTEKLTGVASFRQHLEQDTPFDRPRALASLGTELAALHEQGFVHRDLYPRNVLVSADGARVFFLDAWRGGARPGWRGPHHDLGCWMLYAADLFTPAEQRGFLEAYRQERERRSGQAPPLEALVRIVQRERRGLVRRLARRPGRHAHLRAPRSTWDTSRLFS